MGARWHISPLLAAAAPIFFGLAACGSLTTPDVTTGELSGRLVGGDPAAAHVYVLGKPEVRATIAADGSYTLSRVPVGTTKVVVFDGRDRAEARPVEVKGASRNRAEDRVSSQMPLAGRIVAVPRCSGGSKGESAELVVEGTVVKGERRGDGGFELWPLPPGDFVVRGKLKGFKGAQGAIRVESGLEEPLELPFDVDDEDEARGCKSDHCAGTLKCDGDGKCYECAADADCTAGLSCLEHTCASASALRDGCQACTTDAQCGAGGVCLGAGSSGAACAIAPSASHGCDSGYRQVVLGGKTVCVPGGYPESGPAAACAALVTTFGSSCVVDASCAQSLAGGRCVKASGAAAGVCTAPCDSPQACPKELGLGACVAGYCAPG